VADRLDVAGRSAQGRVAVEHTQRYVRACRALGYEHPDLTSHPSQIRDWYDTEDGLDLHVLDGDCAQLRAAGAAAAEALEMQHAQLSELEAAWTGPGADSALRFLERHCDAGGLVANELRAAAQRCESLRDNLWYLLDSKAATAIAIDDRTLAQRSAWLAAADTVTTGVGDRATAEGVVHQQITPYVDDDIRNDWLDTMRSTLAGVVTSYDMVTDRMAATSTAHFEFPGDLGPGCQPLSPAATSPPVAAAPVAPAAAYPSLPADPAPATNPSTPATPQLPLAAPTPELGTAPGDIAAMPTAGGDPGGLGGGLSGLGGLGGLASRIVDAMGGLLGSATDQLTDPSTFDDPLGTKNPFDQDPSDEDAFDEDADEEHADQDADDKPDAKADDTDEPEAAEEPELAEAAGPVNAPPADPPPPALVQPPVEPPPPAAAPTGGSVPQLNGSPPIPPSGSTPCEIAADQLPQAGQ
jgi:hypothetical protein